MDLLGNLYVQKPRETSASNITVNKFLNNAISFYMQTLKYYK